MAQKNLWGITGFGRLFPGILVRCTPCLSHTHLVYIARGGICFVQKVLNSVPHWQMWYLGRLTFGAESIQHFRARRVRQATHIKAIWRWLVFGFLWIPPSLQVMLDNTALTRHLAQSAFALKGKGVYTSSAPKVFELLIWASSDAMFLFGYALSDAQQGSKRNGVELALATENRAWRKWRRLHD